MSEEAKPEPDVYEPPTIRRLGSVQELTQAAVPGPYADYSMQGGGHRPGSPLLS
jgi:hypothetical protein